MKGHIQKRGTSWRVVIDCGKDPATGKRRQHFETVKGSKSVAQRRLAELLIEIEKGGYVKTPRTLTVAEYLADWLANHAAVHCRARTAQGYE